MQDLERRLKAITTGRDNKVNMLTQECERLNTTVMQRNQELRQLGVEVHEQQESVRMSSAQQAKMRDQLNEYKNKFQLSTEESETYKKHVQKLLKQAEDLNEEVRGAQEAMRLSAGQMSKLQNEYKLVCKENQ